MVVDTSIFIEFLRSKDKKQTTLACLPDRINHSLSTVTLFELLMGAKTKDHKKDVAILVEDVNVIPFDEIIAQRLLKYICS